MRVYFLSDFHLGASYLNDVREAEMRVVSFLDSIKNDADEIFLVGDILDYWFEYKAVVPKGFVRFFGKLAELSDKGIRITWLIGNHDIWIFDYLPEELGITVVDGNIVREFGGKKFFISHGDGVGEMKSSFKMIRSVFRNKFCQKLYSAIHPRWTVPFAKSWSKNSRKKDSGYDGEVGVKSLLNFAKNYSSEHTEINYFIFGHVHKAEMIEISDKTTFVSLGDWISHCSYAVFDGASLQLLFIPQSK